MAWGWTPILVRLFAHQVLTPLTVLSRLRMAFNYIARAEFGSGVMYSISLLGDLSPWGQVVPTWISAASSLGGLLAAVVAGVVGFKLLRNDEDREDARLSADKRDQAEQISAWSTVNDQHQPFVVFANSSTQPVYDLVATVVIDGEPVAVQTRDLLEPTHDMHAETSADDTVTQALFDAWAEVRKKAVGYTPPFPGPRVAIAFVDARGNRWRRDDEGLLYDDGSAYLVRPAAKRSLRARIRGAWRVLRNRA